MIIKYLDDSSHVLVMGKVSHKVRIYYFSHLVPNYPSIVLLAQTNEMSKLWHECYGHVNYHCLQQLSERNMVIGLPYILFYDGMCLGCVVRKHPYDNYVKGQPWRGFKVFNLLMMHFGPFLSLSFDRAHFFLTFINDYSKHTWLYFLQHKN
jgi:hypothetical protein